MKHVMLLGAGCHPSASAEEDATAQGLVKEGPSRICGEQEDINFVPNTIEEFHARKQVRLTAFCVGMAICSLSNRSLAIITRNSYA